MTAEVSMTAETYGVVLDSLASAHLRLEEQLKAVGPRQRPLHKALCEEQLRVTLAMSELLKHDELRRHWLDALAKLSERTGAQVHGCAGAREHERYDDHD